MGAGTIPAGRYRACAEAPVVVPPAREVPEVQAIYRDPATKDFPRDAQGFYVGVHPVDARVALQMTVVAKSIMVAPDRGNTLRSIRLATPDVTSRVTNEVRRVLKDEVSAGNITITKIEVDTSEETRLLAKLTYINLRLPEQLRREKTIEIPLGGATPNPAGG